MFIPYFQNLIARFLSKSDLRIYINATETRKENITDLSKLFNSFTGGVFEITSRVS